jgi:membrane protein implicated in regulation of membrane protease activity
MHCLLQSNLSEPPMRFLGFGLLAIVAAALVAVMLLGIALRIVVFAAVLVAAIGGIGWMMRKLKGPDSKGLKVLEGRHDAEHLPR